MDGRWDGGLVLSERVSGVQQACQCNVYSFLDFLVVYVNRTQEDAFRSGLASDKVPPMGADRICM